MEHIQAMWLHTSSDRPVGIVKAWDSIEERWKFYIGTGFGRDLNEDIQLIMDLGQKFYTLDFIGALSDLTPPEEEHNENP